MDSRKMVLMKLFVGSNGETDIENRLRTWGDSEIYGKRNMETYITICKIDSQWEFAL